MRVTDLGLLQLFVRIVDTGSLSAAARELGMTLPVASRRLRQLESLLDVRLLHRTTRRQSLTEEGELLRQHAVQMLAELEDVEQRLSQRSATVAGHLRVTAPVAVGRQRIAPLLADFRILHPALHVQLHLADAVLDLLQAGMDVAIRYGAQHDSSYISRHLAANQRVLCASPAYLRRHGVPSHPADLARHQCLSIGEQSHADWHFEGREPVTVRIEARLACNDGEVVHRWALDGHGIARKSIWDVADDLRAGRLVQVLADHPMPAAPLHAVYPHSRHLAPRVRVFLDYLAQNLKAPD